MNTQKATFAMGCFWQPDILFGNLKGVTATTVGYTGGHVEKPSYEQVCTGQTGHAEAVEIQFNPDEISYDKLLDVFWQNHNPTTMNRQGPDIGEQYRSAIFYHDASQKTTAEKTKQQLQASGKWPKPIVTEITEASVFYPAEDYHQKYLAKRGLASCHI